ncbi:MAG: alpha/beta fold hydrolase [Candidatus Dormibacteraeota bacterium]|nr:alpha/beta fold hydrolase [Candidatus Dormibacteraeota bacterium]
MSDALLLVHGFPLDHRMWHSQIEGLADVRRVIAPDIDGHGSARGLPPADSMDGIARQMARQLDGIGVDTVDLGGMSMGGYVCFAFWRLFPDRVRSLVLVDTKAAADTEAGREGRDALAAKIRNEGAHAAADAMLPKMFTRAAPEHIRGIAQEIMLKQPPEALIADLMAMKARPDSTPDLPGISVPVLVLVGDADEVTPPAEAQKMVDALPSGRLVTIPGGAHLSAMERAAEVNAAIHEHVSSPPAAGA